MKQRAKKRNLDKQKKIDLLKNTSKVYFMNKHMKMYVEVREEKNKLVDFTTDAHQT